MITRLIILALMLVVAGAALGALWVHSRGLTDLTQLPRPRGQFQVATASLKGKALVSYPATSTTSEATIVGGAHPLLILLPAMDGLPTDYTVIASDLASFGYIVAGIYPPQNAALDLNRRMEMQGLVDRWARAATTAVDDISKDPRFNECLNMKRIGVLGHSFGGAVAVHLAKDDPRFQSAANLDGAPEGNTVENLTRPVLFLNGAPLPPSQKKLNDEILAEMKAICSSDSAGCVWKDYPEAGHMNFSDRGVTTTFRRSHQDLTEIDGTVFLRKVSDELLRFFGSP